VVYSLPSRVGGLQGVSCAPHKGPGRSPAANEFGPFLPRDAMRKHGLCRHAVSVCVSVCLCVCHVRELRQNE